MMLRVAMLIVCLAGSVYAEPLVTGLPSFERLAQQVKPVVVNISTTKQVRSRQAGRANSPMFDQFFEDFYGIPQTEEASSLGSGFLIDSRGYIITNHHVIAGAQRVTVRLSDGNEYGARFVGSDPATDIAVIQIQRKKKFPMAWIGDSDALKVGAWVAAVGNPFGLEQTITAGIVSAKERVIGAGPYDNFIQTDASINPGNSGGPLFNLEGQVVGINTAVVSSGQGIGFAIPINLAMKLVPQLIEQGRVEDRGWLGVTIQPLTTAIAQSLGLASIEGALISDVAKNSPAQHAGLRRGDVIVMIGNKRIRRAQELPGAIANLRKGSRVVFTVSRRGSRVEVPVQFQ